MNKDQFLQAKEPWYRRLLGRVNRRSVRYDGTTITVEEPHEQNRQTVVASTLAGVTLTKGITTNSLTIRTKDGQIIEADGLAKSASADLHRALSNEIQERELDQAAARQATQLAPIIHHKAEELQRALPADRYIRHSTALQLRDTIQSIQHECTDRVRRHLDAATTSSLNIIDEQAQVLSDEEHRHRANEARTEADAKRVTDATTDILPSGLTHEQARAIATDEDTTLVLAGAVRPSCPVCNRGALVRSQSGDNLRCTNSPVCRHLSPRCPNCRVGYATIDAHSTKATCSNPDCHEPPRICPECRKGVVVLRTNPRRFWACSRYWDTPSCTFTAPYQSSAYRRGNATRPS